MTRSHGGILFFDELTEFRRDVLESLREPLETGSVHVSRSGFKASYPAEFIFVAAANPCHCGWFGSRDNLCKCHTSRVKAYQSRLSGPLLERIDLLTWFEKPKDHHLASTLARVSSKDLLERLQLALDFRKDRLNRRISEQDAKEVELLGLCKKYKMQQVSFRSQKKILSVARTLADLRLSETVQSEDLDQAFRWSSSYFRSRVLTL